MTIIDNARNKKCLKSSDLQVTEINEIHYI